MTIEDKLREHLKRSIADTRIARGKLRELEARQHEPIAIVGIGCRFPGAVHSADELWQLVSEGADVVSGLPMNRGWDESVFDADADAAGTTYTRTGGFLYDADEFDASFFGISPREALAMDPQQRVLLETAWEALEDAGIDPASLHGSATGVFAGLTDQDYGPPMGRMPEELEGLAVTGGIASVASGRVAYCLGLVGPAVTIDTACSSSLVALHLAVRSLRSGESSLALAGGVCVLATPGLLVEFARQRVIAADGRCKAFAEAADGAGWSEGAGLLVLERLSDAQRNGHRVLAVVRGTAINQDGASNGLTAPNGPSQQRVIRQALADAGVSAHEVDVVEAHGTGTRLGDPIEAEALLATYGQDRPVDRPLWLGSLKSNIGHAQAAAGVGGVIKMVQAMRHALLPKTLHVDVPSSRIHWSSGGVRLLVEQRRWDRGTRPRRAGVSSFGISGTNAHVILEEAPAADPPAADETHEPPAVAWVLSAKSANALRAQAQRLLTQVRADPELSVLDIGWSLLHSRARFAHRAVVVGADRPTLLARLAEIADGTAVEVGVAEPNPGGVVFVFPGQGSQWIGMARQLHAESPVFADALTRCDQALAPLLGWSVTEVVVGTGDAQGVDVIQPALFAVMVSLAEVWRSLGVRPDAVVGHSQGEIAAVCVAGGLSLDDAAVLIARRSRLLRELAGNGRMLAVPLSRAEVAESLRARHRKLSIAAVNGPRSVVVSGTASAADEYFAELVAAGIGVRLIPVDYASHSAEVEPVRDQLLRELTTVTPRSATIPVWSTVTGGWLDTAAMDVEYWYRNLREPVEFEHAVRGLAAAEYRTFVEVSPHPVLTLGVAETVEDAGVDAVIAGTLRREHGGFDELLRQAAGLFVRGVGVDWAPSVTGGVHVPLPRYPFERKRYWLEWSADPAGIRHPLLPAGVDMADGGVVLTGELSLSKHPWLIDHAVADVVLVPGTALVELVIAAGDRVGCGRVEELTLPAPLLMPERGGCTVQAVVSAPEDGRCEVAVYSRPSASTGEWTRHAVGVLSVDSEAAVAEWGQWPPRGAAEVDPVDLYRRAAERGYSYGPAFRGLRRVWRRDGEYFAEAALSVDPAGGYDGYLLHPALFDSALHVLLAGAEHGAALPFSLSGVRVHAKRAASLRVRVAPVAADAVSVDLADDQGRPVATIESLTLREAAPESLRATVDGSLLTPEWVPVAVPEVAGTSEDWVRIGTADDIDVPVTRSYGDLDRLQTGIAAGEPIPAVTVMSLPTPGVEVVESVYTSVDTALRLVQQWLADERLSGTRLVLLTRNAIVVDNAESTRAGSAFAGAAVWGLLRSAQAENPDRILLLDLDDSVHAVAAIRAALDSSEPQLVLRAGQAYAARLVRSSAAELEVPAAPTWRLDRTEAGSIDGLALLPYAQANAPLAPGMVRVEVRAAAVNFRDVLIALDMYPGEPVLGAEGAGVVLEVGAGVDALAPGDRVLGLFPAAFGPIAVADARMVAPMPAEWSFVRAAAIPAVYLTAYYGLVDLAGLCAGAAVLVHAGTGGVGMAAIQLARHLGAQVYATASPAKHSVLRELGLDDAHIASSRSTEFEDRFRTATGGKGFDVVLNALAGEFTDASLRLTARGGRFVEMGKTDVRDPKQYPEIDYLTFELDDAGGPRIREMLAEVLNLFRQRVFDAPPVRVWDVRRARQAFRFMSAGKHIGKNVLGIDATWDAWGTVLITGAAGVLGSMAARHLVAANGIRHLLLVSRRGAAAPDATKLRSELLAAGAETVTFAACDVADRDALAAVLAEVPRAHPLRGVVHAAGVLDDGVVTALTPERVARVLDPKVAGAWHLHELTRDHDLTAFVLYSSAAGLIGTAGQGGYAAANSFLDELARYRSSRGLPATSLAWGLWEQPTAMTGQLQEVDLRRLTRGGIAAMTSADGLRLLDAALALGEPVTAPMRLDTAALRAGAVPHVFRGLVGSTVRRQVAGGKPESVRNRLAGLDPDQRGAVVREFVADEVAAVLGYGTAAEIGADRAFRELGIDSLSAVELRNRLAKRTGVKLPTTVAFDYPTVTELARFIGGELSGLTTGDSVSVIASDTDDAVAIVGMGCRFPGGVESAEALWDVVAEGVEVVSSWPLDRGWDAGIFDPNPGVAGKSYVRTGAFVPDAGEFDAEFFSIGPREALAMDPQQRLLLETCWEAVEHAGIAPESLRGSATGVFVGVAAQGYGTMTSAEDGVGGYVLTGTSASVVSGRVAYVLGLEGPAISVDTACSSSLVALHQAVRSVRSGECSMALAGGVTVMATPAVFVDFSQQRGLAADGRCKAFAAAADGTGFSEGAGVLVVERLSDARRNGHRVLAVVRGTAINQDGASNGLTAPNGPAQQRVIRQALADAGIAAHEVDVVEAHGTGTRLGDPIEAHALLATYGQGRSADRPLWLGSLKSNIGHTQAAAGVAGVIKMVEALRRGILPKTLHVDSPSAQVDWASGAVELLTEQRSWDTADKPRRAGVSSFGISGTNAHIVLEQAPEVVERQRDPAGLSVVPWVISARTAPALRAQARRLHAWLLRQPEWDPADVGWSLATMRSHFEHRAVVVGCDRAELLSGLAESAQLSQGVAGTAFVLPEHGVRWVTGGRDLRDALSASEWDELAARSDSPSLIEALCADQDALTEWWRTALARRGGKLVELPTYAFQRRRYWLDSASGRGYADAADSWRYRVEWKALANSGTRLSGRWLLVGSGDAPPAEVVRAFTEAGALVRSVDIDADRMSRADLTELIRAEGELSGVVSFAAFDEQPAAHTTRGVLGNLLLIQAVHDAGVEAPMWCVTSGAVAVHADERIHSTSQGQMWGLGQVAGLEFPRWWGGSIDLPAEWDPALVSALPGLLARTDTEDQLALRHSGSYGRRMVRAPHSAAHVRWTPRGTVLITGGTGGIGGYLARWLIRGGAEHVVLAGRRGLDAPGARELADELTGRVTIVACDVTERDQVAAVLSAIDDGDIPLTAVIHAAGIERHRPIADLTPAEFSAVLAPKVTGAQHLDALLGTRSLDAFVLFSSGAATWGSGGLAAYAAGNAYLNSLAEARRARGLVATSVAWGGWAGAGMVEADHSADFLRRRGVRLMDPELASNAMSRAVGSNETALTVADLDWTLFATTYTALRPRPLIAEIPEARPLEDAETIVPLRERLGTMSKAEKYRAILESVRTQVADVLGHTECDAIAADRSFKDLGFDSLAAVETYRRLRAATGLSLPATLVFDYPTAQTLAQFLYQQLTEDEESPEQRLHQDLDRLEETLLAARADSPERRDARARLEGLLAELRDTSVSDGARTTKDVLRSASADELEDFIRTQLGKS
ncbi:SDR family NAD(P)-dependent oxidoreductase [Nocardia sp. NPDC052112]|uniref:SDR family NAD(P)-dependent oxidoreductase n=1 Tax=Nocardia sp. NPDC052112 TaxID=3155646 RepID=UPI00341457C9